MTIHELAEEYFRRNLRLYGVTSKGNRKPGWVRGKAKYRAAMRNALAEATRNYYARELSHLERDYRPGIGSGRSADWHLGSFWRYQSTAKALHKALGLTKGALRFATRGIYQYENIGFRFNNMPELPNEALDGLVGRIRAEQVWSRYTIEWVQLFAGNDKGKAINYLIWLAITRLVVDPVIGEDEAARTLSNLKSNPEATIDGYLASSILSWRDGKSGYEGCSGCQSYSWFKVHPELWDYLLSRAPKGATGPGWAQVYPHELDRREHFKALGWFETFRTSDSIFTVEGILS